MGTAEVERVNTTKRLQALRELMAQEKYDVNALIVPSEDQRTVQPDLTQTLLLTPWFLRFQ